MKRDWAAFVAVILFAIFGAQVRASAVEVNSLILGWNDNFAGGGGGDKDNNDAIFSLLPTNSSELFINSLGTDVGSFQSDPSANASGTPYINGVSTDGVGVWNSNAYIQCTGVWTGAATSGSPCEPTPYWGTASGGPAEFYFSGTGDIAMSLQVDNPTVAAWWQTNQFGIYYLNDPNTLIPEFGYGTSNWQGSSVNISLDNGAFAFYESTQDGVCKTTVGQDETGCAALYGNVSNVPEPASLGLIGLGLLSLGLLRRHLKR